MIICPVCEWDVCNFKITWCQINEFFPLVCTWHLVFIHLMYYLSYNHRFNMSYTTYGTSLESCILVSFAQNDLSANHRKNREGIFNNSSRIHKVWVKRKWSAVSQVNTSSSSTVTFLPAHHCSSWVLFLLHRLPTGKCAQLKPHNGKDRCLWRGSAPCEHCLSTLSKSRDTAELNGSMCLPGKVQLTICYITTTDTPVHIYKCSLWWSIGCIAFSLQ